MARTHWFGEDVATIDTTLEAAPSLMPTFDRGPFGANRKSFATWRSTKVPRRDLEKWVDGPVADAWGPLAAARVYGISTTGVDGRPAQRFKGAVPHRWQLTEGLKVPGTDAPCDDGYEIAQVLAWVAAQRGNVAQRLQWRGQIRTLMSHLVPAQS